MIDVNVKGMLYGIVAALPVFRRQGSGHFVNLTSTAGHKTVAGQAVYSGQLLQARDRIAILPDAIAHAIAYAVEQPPEVDAGEIIVRPTAQG